LFVGKNGKMIPSLKGTKGCNKLERKISCETECRGIGTHPPCSGQRGDKLTFDSLLLLLRKNTTCECVLCRGQRAGCFQGSQEESPNRPGVNRCRVKIFRMEGGNHVASCAENLLRDRPELKNIEHSDANRLLKNSHRDGEAKA